PIPIVIEPRAASPPANLVVVDAGFAGDIRKRAVAVVVKENVVSPEATEEIVPAVVVVVAHADAGLPARAAQSRFLRHIGKGPVAVVLVKVRGWSLPRRPVGI